MSRIVEVPLESLRSVGAACSTVSVDGRPALRVAKAERFDEFDIDTMALADGLDFHNGVIEARVMSRLLPDAPDFARGFTGITFRVSPSAAEFESFYVRPTNGIGCEDPIRRQHGCQYFSYPGYTFAYFRHHAIEGYEAPLPQIALDRWIDIRAVIEGDSARFYVDGSGDPSLMVDDLKHGANARGGVGIYVDTGTEAFVQCLKVTHWD